MSKKIFSEVVEPIGRKPLQHSMFFELTFEVLVFAQAFLRSVLPPELVSYLDVDNMSIESKNLFDVMFKETRADVVYRVPIRDSQACIDFFVVLEHKSFDDFWTIFQSFCYSVRICERTFKQAKDAGLVDKSYRLPPVIIIIIHHGETPFTASTELRKLFYDLPMIDEFVPNMKAILFDLSKLDESAIPSDPNVPELKAVLKIMKEIFSREIGIKAEEVFEALRPYS
ncbi:MAG: Rpn family recombination-promoting nuclease/putative transposase, partial [Planctomycetaceae bacterium]|nr:Rpn family recombination-promoting nuclease/putative transposase [Planctomycetaceae bacterium]